MVSTTILDKLEISEVDQETFRHIWKLLQDYAHQTALEKGWWNPPKTFGEQLVLFHSEITEALEEYRGGFQPNETYYKQRLGFASVIGNAYEDKPEGVPIELADLFIRVFDTCSNYDIDLLDAVLLKMAYNETRSHRHGDKTL